MALTDVQKIEISKNLIEASVSHNPLNYVTDTFPEITISEAYDVQMHSYHTRINNSEVSIGRKIGLSSKPNQELFKIDQPAYGHLFESMVVPENEPLSLSQLFKPVIEPEICFVLNRDLQGPGVDIAKVLSATAGVMPAIEIADLRYKNGFDSFKVQDLIADNCGASKVILGGSLVPVSGIDLRLIGMVLEVNGELYDTAAGASVLGNPAQPVAMMANALAQYDIGLKAGEIIISGSLTSAIPAELGSSYRATFDRLGAVNVRVQQ